ncbi:MAG: glycosyltransferase family 39 protein [Anaerolineales bacterium]|nr:glycosyltransferase family 39 protein [Anaerolineales bacterium]
MRNNQYLWFIVFAIVLLGAPLRLYGLNTHPSGLFGDEAADGLDALRIIAGDRPIFLTENNGREALHAYLVSFSVQHLGRTPAAIRLPSALASTLTTLGVFLVARSLFGNRIGMISALLNAFTVWPIMLGRLATRPALLPLFITFSLWLGITAFTQGGKWRWILSGLLFGAAFYTYTPIRVLLLAPILCTILCLISSKYRRHWKGSVLFWAALALAVSPFVTYTMNNKDEVFGRSAGVAVISPDDSVAELFSTLYKQTSIVLPMLIIPGKGDWNLRHNIPNRAALDPFASATLLIGLLVSLRRDYRRITIPILVFIFISLSPTILSEEPPHFGRSSSTITLLFILPALGLRWVHSKLRNYFPSFLAIALSSGTLLCSVYITTRDLYLDNYLGTPSAGFWFDEQCTIASREINSFLGAGWPDATITSDNSPPHPTHQVLIATNVCPRYSSSGYYTVEFLVPLDLGTVSQFQRYDLHSLPNLSSLQENLLILAIPGDEETLVPLLSEYHITNIVDGPWTPPDNLGNSWLVYRSIYAQKK